VWNSCGGFWWGIRKGRRGGNKVEIGALGQQNGFSFFFSSLGRGGAHTRRCGSNTHIARTHYNKPQPPQPQSRTEHQQRRGCPSPAEKDEEDEEERRMKKEERRRRERRKKKRRREEEKEER
jgi:hypothetical protein